MSGLTPQQVMNASNLRSYLEIEIIEAINDRRHLFGEPVYTELSLMLSPDFDFTFTLPSGQTRKYSLRTAEDDIVCVAGAGWTNPVHPKEPEGRNGKSTEEYFDIHDPKLMEWLKYETYSAPVIRARDLQEHVDQWYSYASQKETTVIQLIQDFLQYIKIFANTTEPFGSGASIPEVAYSSSYALQLIRGEKNPKKTPPYHLPEISKELYPLGESVNK